MSFLDIFSSGKTIDKGVDALISAGDKLVYTDEEKAEMKQHAIKLHIELLQASHPFKITQRILALWYSLLFGIAFIVGLIMSLVNTYIKYSFEPTKEVAKPKLLDLADLLSVVETFGLFIIVLTIVGFYFSGGTLESLKRTFTKK